MRPSSESARKKKQLDRIEQRQTIRPDSMRQKLPRESRLHELSKLLERQQNLQHTKTHNVIESDSIGRLFRGGMPTVAVNEFLDGFWKEEIGIVLPISETVMLSKSLGVLPAKDREPPANGKRHILLQLNSALYTGI